jgi:hypothetical protein
MSTATEESPMSTGTEESPMSTGTEESAMSTGTEESAMSTVTEAVQNEAAATAAALVTRSSSLQPGRRRARSPAPS